MRFFVKVEFRKVTGAKTSYYVRFEEYNSPFNYTAAREKANEFSHEEVHEVIHWVMANPLRSISHLCEVVNISLIPVKE